MREIYKIASLNHATKSTYCKHFNYKEQSGCHKSLTNNFLCNILANLTYFWTEMFMFLMISSLISAVYLIFFFFCGFHVAHLVLTWTCILSVPQVLYWWPLIHTSSCRFMARRSSMPTAGKTWVTWTLIYSPWQRRLINRWAGKQ